MKRRTASCPACSAPVVFEIGSVVAVCDFCQSAVARNDKAVEDHGKVAELVETSSKLRRGLTGKLNKKRFTIMGRVQYKHPAGGFWDEWYLALPGGRWAWLSEAQGKNWLMFERKLTSRKKLPFFEGLEAGSTVQLEAQPSPLSALPSSHCSMPSRLPSLHERLQTLGAPRHS